VIDSDLLCLFRFAFVVVLLFCIGNVGWNWCVSGMNIGLVIAGLDFVLLVFLVVVRAPCLFLVAGLWLVWVLVLNVGFWLS
jgi:hypothetical protein